MAGWNPYVAGPQRTHAAQNLGRYRRGRGDAETQRTGLIVKQSIMYGIPVYSRTP